MTLADREIRLALASKSLIKRLEPSGGAFASTSVDLNLDPILKEFRSISSESKECATDRYFEPGKPGYAFDEVLAEETVGLK